MKIFVTGGCGFIGKKVVEKLIHNGDHVVSPSSSECNLLDYSQVEYFANDCDAIIHLAAHVGGLLYNIENPADIFYKNTLMSMNVVGVARKYGIKKFVAIGSVRAYAENEKPHSESDLWDGPLPKANSPYGYSKRFVAAFLEFASREINYTNLILTNTYGPGMRLDDRITGVAAIVKKIFDAKLHKLPHVTMWGSGMASRDFIYIDDAVNAILFVLNRRYTGSINIGSGCAIKISDFVSLVCRQIGYLGEIRWDITKPEGELYSVLDTRLSESLGFYPKYDLSEGVAQTIAWYEGVMRE